MRKIVLILLMFLIGVSMAAEKKILVADICRDEESFDSDSFVKRVNRFSAGTRHPKVDARLFTLKDV